MCTLAHRMAAACRNKGIVALAEHAHGVVDGGVEERAVPEARERRQLGTAGFSRTGRHYGLAIPLQDGGGPIEVCDGSHPLRCHVPCLCLIHVCTLPAGRMLATVNGQRTLIMQWEDLHIGVQAAVAFVVSFVLLVIAHIALLNQPLGRALWYGLFWGVLATVIIVLGTRAERARRLGKDGDGRP